MTRFILLFSFLIFNLSALSQSIYLDFVPGSYEKCDCSYLTGDESFPKFSQREQNGNLHFRICSEEFVYTKGDICEIKKRDELKISSLEDLYIFENEILAKQVNNDTMVHIIFKSEIDSVFIAESIDDQLVKVYAVKWVEKIE